MRLDANKRKQIRDLALKAERLCRSLDRDWLDDAKPTLEPSLDQARDAAARLRVATAELELLTRLEHGGRS